MGSTTCTEPQCLYKGDLHLYLLPEHMPVPSKESHDHVRLFSAQAEARTGYLPNARHKPLSVTSTSFVFDVSNFIPAPSKAALSYRTGLDIT